MPTTAKKTASRRAAAVEPALPARRPLVDLTADAYDPDTVERLDLFELGGVMYTIPATSPASLALELLDISVEKGEEIATHWLLHRLLGDDGYAALKGYGGLTTAHLAALFAQCEDTLVGPDPKARRSRA